MKQSVRFAPNLYDKHMKLYHQGDAHQVTLGKFARITSIEWLNGYITNLSVICTIGNSASTCLVGAPSLNWHLQIGSDEIRNNGFNIPRG